MANRARQGLGGPPGHESGRGARLPATIEEARLPVRGFGRLRLALEIIREYGHVRWLLLSRDLPQVLSALRSPERPPQDGTVDPALARVIGERLGSAVIHTLSVLPTDRRCLVRSLLLIRLLATRGIHSSLVIGVDAESGFSAHAWVERNGAPLLPTAGYFSRRLVEL